jgi:hypothetical protein
MQAVRVTPIRRQVLKLEGVDDPRPQKGRLLFGFERPE